MSSEDWKQDPEYLELREDFARSFTERARALEAALASGDERAIQEIAHKIAGTAASFGFAEIGELASRIDDAMDSADHDSAKVRGWQGELFQRLKSESSS